MPFIQVTRSRGGASYNYRRLKEGDSISGTVGGNPFEATISGEQLLIAGTPSRREAVVFDRDLKTRQTSVLVLLNISERQVDDIDGSARKARMPLIGNSSRMAARLQLLHEGAYNQAGIERQRDSFADKVIDAVSAVIFAR